MSNRFRTAGRGLKVLALAIAATATPAQAQDATTLEEVMVTAQRREQSLQDVPLSVSALSGETLATFLQGGEDIRALSGRVPGLYAESSNGRVAPRFYIRGLGNIDFDLAASQPVSIVVDEVAQENVILKSFPLFDIAHVEVLRGPQGTLFGRNTPAGIVKFDTVKPSHVLDGHLSVAYGSNQTINTDAAIGGSLIPNTLAGRASILYQNSDDWIDNTFSGQDDALGGFEEWAGRAQLLWDPTEDFSALFSVHARDLDGTSTIFRANILTTGESGLNDNFERDQVSLDSGDNNPQAAQGKGGSIRLDWGLTEGLTLTSITAYETADNRSRGDIDGGFGADFLPLVGPCQPNANSRPCIPFTSESQDGIDDLDQFTQELRLSAGGPGAVFWQAGLFYFDSELRITTEPFFVSPSTLEHSNESWAAFGQLSVDVSERLTLSGGLRWTKDEKDLKVRASPLPVAPVDVSDDQLSWDASAIYALTEHWNIYARAAQGFRAPTIQGRDVAFLGQPSTADSETITSGEIGFKADLLDHRLRMNGAVFRYEIENQQLSAVGGAGNFIQLVNADKGTGFGLELDIDWLLTQNLSISLGYSWTDTEINDKQLRVEACGSGQCTVQDPRDANGFAFVDGNPFPQSPDNMLFVSVGYRYPLGNSDELFLSTDWFRQGKTNLFLYQAPEFQTNGDFEGGVRAGYAWCNGRYEVAAFGRNITDRENLKGAIDFNNNAGFVNEGRFLGLSFKAALN